MLNIGFFSALASLVELDAVYIGQFLISRPCVAGAIFGLLGGDLLAGVQLGLWTEFLLLDHVPVGGYVPPSGGFSAISAFLIHRFAGVDLAFAFFMGLVIGKGFSHVEIFLRNMRSRWNERMEQDVLRNPSSIYKWITKGLAAEFFAGFLYMFCAVLVLGPISVWVWSHCGHGVQSAFCLGYFAVPWIGLASVVLGLYTNPFSK